VVRRLPSAVATAAVMAAGPLVAGCGGTPPSATGAAVTVRTINVPGLGRILADGAGYALYIYVPDHDGPSVCTGVCAEQWPPLVLPAVAGRPRAGPGTKAQLLGSAPRPHGTARQVTYAGWPLYTYVEDGAPGVVTGQGEDMGAWYTMSPDGSVDRKPLGAAG
jgi:predicted lipoprotein with Yx(FWY)xxD motif